MVGRYLRSSHDTLTNGFADVLLLHLYSIELKVHEIAFSKAPVVLNSPGFQRLDALYACLYATKSWFDLFLTISPASFAGFLSPSLRKWPIAS